MNRLIINLETLPEEGMSLKDTLNPEILALTEAHIKPADEIFLDLNIQRFEDELFIQGNIEAPIEFECVRTLHPFIQTVFVENCSISIEIGSDLEIDASEAVREEILILFPAYPKCEDADEEMSCSIDSRYLAVDKPIQDSVDTSPPIKNKDDRWSALDDLPSSD